MKSPSGFWRQPNVAPRNPKPRSDSKSKNQGAKRHLIPTKLLKTACFIYPQRSYGYALRGLGLRACFAGGRRAPLGLRDSGDCSHAPAVRDSAWRKSEIARSACAFAKRARLPQAEDSAPMRVSRIEAPSRFGRQPNVTLFKKRCSFRAECEAFCN